MQEELCLLCRAHKTRMTPYHPASDGLVERFNRTLLMMLAMFTGENRDDWDDLLPVVMMAYRSSVDKSTGFSPYHLIFGEECTMPMDVGLPRQDQDLPDPIKTPYALWVQDALEVAYDQVRRHSDQAVLRQKRLFDKRAVRRLFAVGDWRYYPPANKMQTGFSLDWAISCCFVGRMGCWYSVTTGVTSYPGSLSGREENPTPQWSGVVD